ncbi:hypothetical protein FTX61_03950 [Nitriliruptoraceae bacterium ZYF776]|nr:hypothetical protein [Profundirhabdus halotolerans]
MTELGAGDVVVVVSYFRDGSRYPRAGPAARQDAVYWANIAVHAATLRHVGADDVRIEVHRGNDPTPPAAALLEAAGVHLVRTPFAHQPPDGFFVRFAGSLYLLDTMADLAHRAHDDTVVLFVDPDVVWVAPPDGLVAAVREHGTIAYDLGVPPDVRSGGLTPREEAAMYAELTGRVAPDPPVHFGGECYGVLGADLRRLVATAAPLWDAALDRHDRGLPHHNVEEHVLDAALWQLGVTRGRVNDHLERIMTLPLPFGSRQRYRPELAAWHLPSEKTLGLRRVFDHLVAGRPLPPVDDGYHAWLRRRVGIDRTPIHAWRDLTRTVKWTLTGEARAARARGQVGLGL